MKTILYLSPYSAFPARYGGAMRINNLCREVSRQYQVMHFAQRVQRDQVAFSLAPVIQQITPNYIEYSSRNPLNTLLYGAACRTLKIPPFLQSEVLGITSPQWLHKQLQTASIVNVEHPWQFLWVYRQVVTRKPIVVTAHNVEADLCIADDMNIPRPLANFLMRDAERREAFAMRYAARIFTTSAEDINSLVERYNVPPQKCVIIPNGVDCKIFMPVTPTIRQERKQALGLADRCVVVFSGSTHQPNREAVQQIIDWLDYWSSDLVHFLIIGSIGRAFTHIKHPQITFTGLVEDTRPYSEAADIAINPMISGSGTNLKQVEYMAMGLPSIATPVGARGIGLVDGTHGYICSLQDFPAKLRWLVQQPEIYGEIGRNARLFVEKTFDWMVIGQKVVSAYHELEAESSTTVLENREKSFLS